MKKNDKPKTIDDWILPKETFLFKFWGYFLLSFTVVVNHIIIFILNNAKFYNLKIIKQTKGPYVFASNHTTMFDSGFLDTSIFLSNMLKSYDLIPYHTPEYGNFYKNPLMSWYMDRVKCIPVSRKQGIDQRSQKIVTQKLKEGKIVHIFPEGTRSRSGKLLTGKAGVGKRIYDSAVSVIPCYHSGMRDLLPVGSYFPRVGKKIRVIIGEPIFFDDLLKLENKPETWLLISSRIMEKIQDLKVELEEKEKHQEGVC